MRASHEARRFLSVPAVLTAAACAGLCLLLTGCLAQKAELLQVSQDLDKKISRLDQREKDIEAKNKDLDERIAQTNTLINEARARALSAIREIREEDQPKIQGKIEENDHKVKALDARVEDRATRIEQVMAKRDAELEKRAGELEKRAGSLEKTVSDQTTALTSMAKAVDGRLDDHDKADAATQAQIRTLNEQMVQLNRSLVDFRQVLAGLGDKLVKQEQRSNEMLVKLQADAKAQEQRTNDMSAKLQADAKATSDHLDKVTKSVGTVAKTLEAVGAKLLAQDEAQERRLDDVAKSLHAATAQMQALSHTVAKLQGKNVKGKTEVKAGRPASGQAPAAPEPKAEPQPTPVIPEPEAGAPEPAPAASADEPPSVGLATAPGSTSESPSPVVAPPAGEASPQAEGERAGGAKAAYDRSFQRFKQRDFDGALEGFSEFLTQHPTSKLAPNAQYWIGECYFGKNEYDRAIAAYEQVRVIDPASEKVPAALLKKGLAYLALKDRKKASVALTQVVEVFPKSPEAGKAREKLAQLNQGR
ncbi:MAG: tol-pal system protein YbgF [Nitrospirota bacterium]|nr:tol-pal system protein YbgF [Nitrospirota bacterium]